jgi:hypothetical protein
MDWRYPSIWNHLSFDLLPVGGLLLFCKWSGVSIVHEPISVVRKRSYLLHQSAFLVTCFIPFSAAQVVKYTPVFPECFSM